MEGFYAAVDRRIVRAFGGRRVELRVATLPTVDGEAVVRPVLDPNALRLGWERLGFEPEVERQIVDILAQPSGLFLISGPTGSGKTTTLYTALNHLNDTKRKIITVEEPVEYDLPGIEQVQVNPEAGADFATILRATLRHDPDILMIGEIRDAETVQIACRAALIG
jgi:general secretion pathway protein E